ncbi:MAG: nucleotide exchange factor GrpE [Nitrospinota bacterium]|nr:nucleotide exchange factor GrpE [Nitrospinota bacterium]
MSEAKEELIIKDRRHWVLEEANEKSRNDSVVEADIERLPTYVQQLQLQAEEHDKKLKEYIAAYKEKMVENDQFRARLEKDVNRRVEQGIGSLMKQIVPVLDNLDLAVASADGAKDAEKMREGLVLIRNSMVNILKNSGVMEVECMGKTFNPAVAEAVASVAVENEDEDNIVIEVLQSGYMLNELLIRPARVKVGKYEKR